MEACSRADLAGRAEANVGDVRAAMEDVGIDVHQMHYLLLTSKLEPACPEVDFPLPPPEVATAAMAGTTTLAARYGGSQSSGNNDVEPNGVAEANGRVRECLKLGVPPAFAGAGSDVLPPRPSNSDCRPPVEKVSGGRHPEG